jgi:hypothetical protein
MVLTDYLQAFLFFFFFSSRRGSNKKSLQNCLFVNVIPLGVTSVTKKVKKNPYSQVGRRGWNTGRAATFFGQARPLETEVKRGSQGRSASAFSYLYFYFYHIFLEHRGGSSVVQQLNPALSVGRR